MTSMIFPLTLLQKDILLMLLLPLTKHLERLLVDMTHPLLCKRERREREREREGGRGREREGERERLESERERVRKSAYEKTSTPISVSS